MRLWRSGRATARTALRGDRHRSLIGANRARPRIGTHGDLRSWGYDNDAVSRREFWRNNVLFRAHSSAARGAADIAEEYSAMASAWRSLPGYGGSAVVDRARVGLSGGDWL